MGQVSCTAHGARRYAHEIFSWLWMLQGAIMQFNRSRPNDNVAVFL